MVGMWDELFSSGDIETSRLLAEGRGTEAFEHMHQLLDRVWASCDRCLRPWAWVAINIGDATRRVGGDFRLYPNHSRIAAWFHSHGYRQFPSVIWKKTTNAPNKFMGSGMLPKGAYVTLEHEYILIFRKEGPIGFKPGTTPGHSAHDLARQLELRRASALFWEERNAWFSDLWDCSPSRQEMNQKRGRDRSAAFPFEIPWRLIHMYSQQGDTVMDPFAGTGTTAMAAMAAGRHSVSIDLLKAIADTNLGKTTLLAAYARQRLDAHEKKVQEELRLGKSGRYIHPIFLVPVHSRQEMGLSIPLVERCDLFVTDQKKGGFDSQSGLSHEKTWKVYYSQVLKATR